MNRAPYSAYTLALSALLVLTSCALKNAEDLTGTWQPTDDSVRNFGVPGQPQIVLNPDRSFSASGIQEGLFYNPEPLQGHGTWKRIGDYLFLHFSEISDKSFEVQLLVIADAEKPTMLSFYRGGRSDGYRFLFEKS